MHDWLRLVSSVAHRLDYRQTPGATYVLSVGDNAVQSIWPDGFGFKIRLVALLR